MLQSAPCPLEQLQAATRISRWALSRHLKKLEGRGFVVREGRLYAVAQQRNALERELARLAAE